MKCFYHNDMDGRCSGSIVAYFEDNYNKEDYYEVDYLMDLMPIVETFEKGERVYMVDYSLKEGTVLEYMLANSMEVVWIDHHSSSTKFLENNPKYDTVKGIRQEGYCGAYLTYQYLFPDESIPYFIKLVDDYDCWKNQMQPYTDYFKLGIENCEWDGDDLWKSMLSGDNLAIGQPDPVDYVIEMGQGLKSYIVKEMLDYRDRYSYESVIGGYKALVVNRRTNSWIFGDLYDKYPVVCVWAFNGEVYSYSIYSSDKTVDCSAIAESYGGGGHKGASGFSSKELLFTKK